MPQGYVKLWRSIEEWPRYFAEPFTHAQAWIDLVMLANHRTKILRIRGNPVEIKRGQVGWSEEALGKRWQWSRGKVRRFLEEMKTEQQIEQQKSRLLSIITIVNYDMYQGDDTTESAFDPHKTTLSKNARRDLKKKVKNGTTEKELKKGKKVSIEQSEKTTDGTTDGHQTVQQTDTNKNDKNDKNDKNIRISSYEEIGEAPFSRKELRENFLPDEPTTMNTTIDETFPRKRRYGNEGMNWMLDYFEHLYQRKPITGDAKQKQYLLHLKRAIGYSKLRELLEFHASPDSWWHDKILGFDMIWRKRSILLQRMEEDRTTPRVLNLDEIKT